MLFSENITLSEKNAQISTRDDLSLPKPPGLTKAVVKIKVEVKVEIKVKVKVEVENSSRRSVERTGCV